MNQPRSNVPPSAADRSAPIRRSRRHSLPRRSHHRRDLPEGSGAGRAASRSSPTAPAGAPDTLDLPLGELLAKHCGTDSRFAGRIDSGRAHETGDLGDQRTFARPADQASKIAPDRRGGPAGRGPAAAACRAAIRPAAGLREPRTCRWGRSRDRRRAADRAFRKRASGPDWPRSRDARRPSRTSRRLGALPAAIVAGTLTESDATLGRRPARRESSSMPSPIRAKGHRKGRMASIIRGSGSAAPISSPASAIRGSRWLSGGRRTGSGAARNRPSRSIRRPPLRRRPIAIADSRASAFRSAVLDDPSVLDDQDPVEGLVSATSWVTHSKVTDAHHCRPRQAGRGAECGPCLERVRRAGRGGSSG